MITETRTYMLRSMLSAVSKLRPTMTIQKPLIAIIGTTGVGKSQLSVELAKAVNGEIINGDSMQMYRGLDNITNKHPIPEREGIPHHLLGHTEWDDEYSVKRFEDEATEIIDDIHARGKVPILVGGTHYYTQAVLFKNSTIASSDTIEKQELSDEQSAILDDPVQVMQRLKECDPLVAEKFHPNDTRRLRRALEIYFTTGKRPSEIYQEQTDESLQLRYRALVLWIWSDYETLDPRLDKRVDQMIQNGLYEEINEMFQVYKEKEEPVDLERGVWQVIGFKQFLPWLQKVEDSPESGITEMKTLTRRYAKKQTKWIQKKLLFMMNQVEGLKNVGLLDATDLSQWNMNVRQRGVAITQAFLQKRDPQVPLAPVGLENMLSLRSEDDSFHQEKWKHFTCDACKDDDGSNLVFVGEEAWSTHLRGRKHRGQLKRLHQGERDEYIRVQKEKAAARAAAKAKAAAAAADDDHSNTNAGQ